MLSKKSFYVENLLSTGSEDNWKSDKKDHWKSVYSVENTKSKLNDI